MTNVGKIICDELGKYEGITVEDIKISPEIMGLTVKFKGVSFTFQVHQMLDYRHHEFCRMVIELIVMDHARGGLISAV